MYNLEKTMIQDQEIYQSPFSWRYGSNEMRRIWGEVHKRRLWRQLWVALADAQADFGLVQAEQVEDLRQHAEEVDVSRSIEIEKEIQHDLMAEVKAFAEQCRLGGGIIHLGATSMDIKDNADAIRLRQSLDLVIGKTKALLGYFCEKIAEYADFPIIAFTHLQPAEPTTLGYRLAQYTQDLFSDWENLVRMRANIRGKGFKGAVGSSASYSDLLGLENLELFQNRLSELIDLPFYPVTTQIYPRKQDYLLACYLAGLGASLNKFAFDLRFLQSPSVGELAEPFGRKQVGSSAMPFKRNPVQAEKIDSLARLLAQMPRLTWDNEALCLLEITLDESANRRTVLPEMFLISDELLETATRIVQDLQIDQYSMQRNLAAYGPFAATERVLMAVCKRGADRQEMHERLRHHSLAAWKVVRQGGENPLSGLILNDPVILSYVQRADLEMVLDVARYLGDAPQRARNLVRMIREEIKGI